LQHVHSGLWVLGNYGHLDDDFSNAPEAETYYIKAGLRRRWHPLGHTIMYGEWLKGDDGAATVGLGLASSSDLKVWGMGVVQEIDAAAMSMWLSYRNMDLSDNSVLTYQDMKTLKFGALINF
jgi:hypothetical protein